MATNNCPPTKNKTYVKNGKKISVTVRSAPVTGSMTAAAAVAMKEVSPIGPTATATNEDDPMCCTVCGRFDHAAMFNIFKCFCLAQRIFRTTKLLKFRQCHLKSSYVCEECVECLEVIEEVEILKREFVQNFLQRCRIEVLPTEGPKTTKDVSNKVALGVISEGETASVITTRKVDSEPEVMFVGRIKRQLSLMPTESDDQPEDSEKDINDKQFPKKWRVDVLTSPNELGGMSHLDLASLPTIRQLFTLSGLRRYWLLPPKTPPPPPSLPNAAAMIRKKRRRCSELVQYLKQQTASNALLASIRRTEDVDGKRIKKARTQGTADASLPVCPVNTPKTSEELPKIVCQEKESLHNVPGADDDRVKSDAATATVRSRSPDKSASHETAPKSPSDELHIILSDEDSVEFIAEKQQQMPPPPPTLQIEKTDEFGYYSSDDPLFRLVEKKLIENVVESFLQIDDAEIQQLVERNSDALKRMLTYEPIDLPVTPPLPPPPPLPRLPAPLPATSPSAGRTLLNQLLHPKAVVKTKRVAAIIRPIAPKSDSTAASASTSTSRSSSIAAEASGCKTSAGTSNAFQDSSTSLKVVGRNPPPLKPTTVSDQPAQYAILSNTTTSQQLMLVRNSDTGAVIYVTPPLVTLPLRNICP